MAEAIPVFARIYGKPCSACHTVYPQLNPAGEYFRAKGLHSMEAKVQPIRIAPGFEVPGTLPIAFSLAAGEDVSRVSIPHVPDSTQDHLNLEFAAVLAGGELGPHLAFLADYAPAFSIPQTGDLLTNHNLGLGFLQGHAEPWGWLMNLKAGLLELPLGTSPRVHRLSMTSYLLYGLSAFSLLGRQRPIDSPALSETQIAFELSGLDPNGGANFAAGVANGTNNQAIGRGELDAYVRLAQNFGLHKAGLFAYYSPDFARQGGRDEGFRLGPDVNFFWRQAGLRGQFLAGYDDSPTGQHVELWSYGAFAEGEYRWTPAIVTLARFEWAAMPTFDDTGHGGTTRVRRRVFQVTGGAQYLLLENLKLIFEANYGENREVVAERKVESWLVTFRIATAFWPLTPPGLDLLFPRVATL
jgi:hypothetical protein